MKTIKDEWLDFEKIVINPAAGIGQRADMERSFYAGAYAMYLMLTAGIADLSDEDAEKALETIDAEMQAILHRSQALQLSDMDCDKCWNFHGGLGYVPCGDYYNPDRFKKCTKGVASSLCARSFIRGVKYD